MTIIIIIFVLRFPYDFLMIFQYYIKPTNLNPNSLFEVSKQMAWGYMFRIDTTSAHPQIQLSSSSLPELIPIFSIDCPKMGAL